MINEEVSVLGIVLPFPSHVISDHSHSSVPQFPHWPHKNNISSWPLILTCWRDSNKIKWVKHFPDCKSLYSGMRKPCWKRSSQVSITVCGEIGSFPQSVLFPFLALSNPGQGSYVHFITFLVKFLTHKVLQQAACELQAGC